jgi:outer membrane protein insertion porin family
MQDSQRMKSITLILGFSMATTLLASAARSQGPGDQGLPAFQERKFSDRLWETGGPRTNQIHDGKMVTRVEIVGNQTVSQHRILSHMQTRQDRSFDDKQLTLDIAELHRTDLFQKITTDIVESRDGVVVRITVKELPMVAAVHFLGATRVSKRELAKHCGIEVGDACSPISVEMAQQRLRDLYYEKGLNQVGIQILKGNKPDDREVIFDISEGPVERVFDIKFVGNRLFGSDVLKTKLDTKDSWKGAKPFANLANKTKIEDDVQKLMELYRSLGYFDARVDYFMEYYPRETLLGYNWVDVTFVVDEGQQYRIRSVSIVGNKYPPFTTDLLMSALELRPGDAFNNAKMGKDKRKLRNDFYGRDGFIHVDISPQAVFLDEPGWLDLVYKINEGSQYVAGDVNIHMVGDDNHTKRHVVLSQLSVVPGQLIDLRELEASERRLKLIQVFEDNPAVGTPPHIEVRRADQPGPK